MSDSPIKLETDEQRVSYGFGMQFGQQILRNKFDGLDVDLIVEGMRAIAENKAVSINEAEMQASFDVISARRTEKAEKDAKNMAKLGVEFLQKNGEREGVITLESGVQYEVLEAGSGAVPVSTDTVRVHYEGSLITGDVFDSSVARGEPAEFGVTQVIPGWVEVLQMMEVGAKWLVAIPADKAYGPAGSPPVIPGNATLVFQIHLIAIV